MLFTIPVEISALVLTKTNVDKIVGHSYTFIYVLQRKKEMYRSNVLVMSTASLSASTS